MYGIPYEFGSRARRTKMCCVCVWRGWGREVTDDGTWAPWNTFTFPKYLGTLYAILILPKNTHAIGGKTVVIELRTTIFQRAEGIFSLLRVLLL